METIAQHPNTHRNKKAALNMGDGYIKYVQECNAKVKSTGNTNFKAEPEFAWERKQKKV